jgi:biotin carboxyl carrier protein
MRDDADMRSLAQTIGSAALGVSIGVGVLVAGFWVSNLALARSTTTLATSSATANATPARTAPPTTAPSPAATVAATAARTVAPTATPVPTPTKDPLTVTAYSGQGLRLAALGMPVGYTLTSPIAGSVTIALYQFVDGEVRTGVPEQPSYPYIFVRSADREIKLRPGLIDKDVQLLVKDGDTIAAGAPLFRILTAGASSWATFYDKTVTAQVMASVTTRPQGTEVDPVPVFKR